MKLQPQDLRLGITLYDSLRKKEIKLELKHFKELAISEEVFFERYKAIKLTEEKLLSFGFIMSDDGKYLMDEYIASFKADYPLWIGKEGCCQGETIKDNIKCVHELQNLHYSLKNEELPIA